MAVKVSFHIGHSEYETLLPALKTRSGLVEKSAKWDVEDNSAHLIFDRLIDVPCALRPYVVQVNGDSKEDVFLNVVELIMKGARKIDN